MATVLRPSLPWWSWWTLLSLDAPLVAVVWQDVFARVAAFDLRLEHRLLLFLAVWLSYLADRWLDGLHLHRHLLHTARHLFYSTHQRSILVLWCALVAVTLFVALSTLSPLEWLRCLGLLFITALYLTMSHCQPWPIKELGVSVLFPIGLLLFIVPQNWPAILSPLTGFALLCFFNLSFIAVWEINFDKAQGQPSLIRSHPGLGKYLPLLAGISLLGFVWQAWQHPVYTVLALALLALLGLHYASQLTVRHRRSLADLCLLVPALPCLFWL